MPLRPSASRQLLDLAFPFSLYEQAPFVGRDVSALTLTTQGDTPAPAGSTPRRTCGPCSNRREWGSSEGPRRRWWARSTRG